MQQRSMVDAEGLILIQINRIIKAAFSTSEARASFLVKTGTKIVERLTGVIIPIVTTGTIGIVATASALVVLNPSDSIVNDATEEMYLYQKNSKNAPFKSINLNDLIDNEIIENISYQEYIQKNSDNCK